ncbi:MAG: hypothetical protein IKJ93_05785 [Clostridia bacterium]|nr:hypothetical protein [Clostridia bacterium]
MIFKNEKYAIEFDPKGAAISLESGNKQFIKQRVPLFTLQLRMGEKVKKLISDNAQKIHLEQNDDILKLKYEFENLCFYVTISFNSRIEATFSFENRTGFYVEWVDFCSLAVPNDLVSTGGSGRIAIDTNEGLLIEDIKLKENFYPYKYRPLDYPSEGLYAMFPAVVQSQFLSYYDDTAGIYIAAEDSKRSVKGIDFGPMDDAIKLQFRLYPGVSLNCQHFELSYNLVIDFFSGDWYSAAELYRKWFENNLPENLLPIEDNKSLPEWYSDSPLVVTYPVQGIHDMDPSGPNRLFPYNNALPYLDKISAATGSRILTVLMHWEGTAPWAPPYVWPPIGGADMLADFGRQLHDKNHILGVYCSGISYTISSNINDYNMEKEYLDENLSQYMCASPTGEIISKTCQAQRKSYDMCISQDFTKNVLLNETRKMAASGLDYIQILDQNHGGTPYFCFSDKHSHPAVPGGWMVEHMTDFLKKLKAVVGDKVLLGCESAAAESYIPYMNLSDNRFNLNGYAGKFIPLYAYIYHKYLQNFSGNSVCSLDIFDIERSPDSYLLRAAHSFLAGDFMTLVINQDGEIAWAWGERDFSKLPDSEATLSFIKSATAYKRGVGKKYLTFGHMIKPCKVTCDTVKMYKTNAERFTEYPTVLTTAWQASDGTQAQFFANYCQTPQNITIDLSKTNGADLIDEKGNVIDSLVSTVCELEISANSVGMIVFK